MKSKSRANSKLIPIRIPKSDPEKQSRIKKECTIRYSKEIWKIWRNTSAVKVSVWLKTQYNFQTQARTVARRSCSAQEHDVCVFPLHFQRAEYWVIQMKFLVSKENLFNAVTWFKMQSDINAILCYPVGADNSRMQKSTPGADWRVGQVGRGPKAGRLRSPALFLTKNLCHHETLASKNDGNSYVFLLYFYSIFLVILTISFH